MRCFSIKDLLFSILNKINPYEFIRLSINNNDICVCKENVTLPLAIRFIEYDPEMGVNPNYYYTENDEYTAAYIESHRVSLNGVNYLIETELLEIKYYDDYVYTKIGNIAGIHEYYAPYDSINFIHAEPCLSRAVMRYNKLQYELNN